MSINNVRFLSEIGKIGKGGLVQGPSGKSVLKYINIWIGSDGDENVL